MKNWLAIGPRQEFALAKAEMSNSVKEKRRLERAKAVLSVWVTTTAEDGSAVQEIAHTLDLTSGGVRLGAIRRAFRLEELVTVQYRQRRLQFRVVWIQLLKGTREYQVGLEAVVRMSQGWGLQLPEIAASQTSSAGLTEVSYHS